MKSSHKAVSCKIDCNIDRVVLAKEANYFVLVQFKQGNADKSIKLRTEISALTNRPKYDKNTFTFNVGTQPCMLKFGLMKSKSQLESEANSAMVCGTSSMPITIERLMELENYEYRSNMVLSERGKEIGQFFLTIKAKQFKKKNDDQNNDQKEENYNPLVSRILYDENMTDFSKLKNNIEALEKVLENLHQDLQQSKKQEAFYEKIYLDLEKDEKQIKDEIDRLQKINSKIQYNLNEKQSFENLKIEVDLLSQSQEGKGILLQKLHYYQDRLYREIEQNQKLSIEYKKIRPQLQENLRRAEEHAEKLKNRQIQEFQIQKNEQLLKSYDEILYQFKCNEEAINSLVNMSKKSDLTAQQAKLLLSQVKYEVKLLQINAFNQKKNYLGEEKMLREIEKQIDKKDNEKEQLSAEQQMVYKIKLSALQKQIQQIKAKISEFYATNY